MVEFYTRFRKMDGNNMKANWRLILISFLVMLILIGAGCVNNPTTTLTGDSTSELPYRIESFLTISKAPKIGETAEVTFTVNVIKLDASHPKEGLAKSKAWIDFYWTNTKGSYSEAYGAVQIPLEEVKMSGELPWEGSYSNGLTLKGRFQLPREGIWSIRASFYGEGWLYGTGHSIEVAVEPMV
jgi:hypothetical protein